MNRSRALLATSLAMLSSPCLAQISEAPFTTGHADYPAVNPKPSQQISLKGTMDPKLAKLMRIKISYFARAGAADGQNEESCKQWTNKQMGATGAFSVTEDVELPAEGGSFEVRFALDKYQPGRCNWEFLSLVLEVTSKSGAKSGFNLLNRALPAGTTAAAETRFDLSCNAEERLFPCTGFKGPAFASPAISQLNLNLRSK